MPVGNRRIKKAINSRRKVTDSKKLSPRAKAAGKKFLKKNMKKK